MAVNSQQISRHPKVFMGPQDPMPVVRYSYYALIFSMPFEEVVGSMGIGTDNFALPKMLGYFLIVIASLQPSLCFRRPPKVFWYFVAYLLVFVFLGVLLSASWGLLLERFLRFVQVLILFWISYNLMQYERVIKGTLLTLAVSTVALAALQMLGFTSTVIAQNRITAVGENPNTLSAALTLGLLALIGVAYGRKDHDRKVRRLTWLGSGVLVIAIVSTGSRGPVVALVVGLLVFLLQGRSLLSKLKVGLIVLLALGSLILVSYQVETVRVRWEKTFLEGSMARRENIYPAAWEIFLERPLTGWGLRVTDELGYRLGLKRELDVHNMYLSILAETGLLGAVPFFAALWLCWRAAWRARDSIQGVLPMAMLLCLFTINMTGTEHGRKLFWVVLAYGLASSSYAALPRLRKPVTPRYQRVRH